MTEREDKTVASVYGDEVADELARWAIDALVYPPAVIRTYETRMPGEMIERGRAILSEAGIDWRALKADTRSERRSK